MSNNNSNTSFIISILIIIGLILYGITHDIYHSYKTHNEKIKKIEYIKKENDKILSDIKDQKETIEKFEKNISSLRMEINKKQTRYINYYYTYFPDQDIVIDNQTGEEFYIDDFLASY